MHNTNFENNNLYMGWKPNEKIYKTIIEALSSSCNNSNNNVQIEVTKVLKDLNENVSDAALYLLHIFMNKQENNDVRQVGGLLLKNYINSKNKFLTNDILKIIKNEIFKLVEDEVKEIRNTSGSVITSILTKYEGIEKWPEALYNLLLLVERGNNDVVDGAFRAIIIIIEDELINRKNTDSLFFQFCKTQLLEKLFLYCSLQEKSIRKKYAAECLDLFINASCFATNGIFNEYFPQLWECLGFLAAEEDPQILKTVVTCVTIITDTRYASIFNNLDGIIQFMVNATNSGDRKVQLEALEFWPVFIKDRSYMAYSNYNSNNNNSNNNKGIISSNVADGKPIGTNTSENYIDENIYKNINELRNEALKTLKNYLPYLCKILIDNTVYTKWDYLTMDESHFQNDNANVPDLVQDISPELYHSSNNNNFANTQSNDNKNNGMLNDQDEYLKGQNRNSNINGNCANNNNDNRMNVNSGDITNDNNINDDLDDLSDEEKNDEMTSRTWGNDWTVRKGAALCLDYLSNVYNDDILEYILPHIEEKLMSDKWNIRESAVLSLGAIAKGCMYSLSPFIPKVLEYLIKLLNDEKPLARSISCWCVTRFSSWICHPDNCDKWFEPVLLNLLKRVLDSNKRVQEAACSSFANLEEDALELLNNHLHEIVHTIQQAFQIYQAKNYFILFDVVGTLIDSVNIVKENIDLAHEIVNSILIKWNSIRISSPYIIALMECMSCITSAYGKEFLKYAKIVIRTCIKFLVLLYIDLEEEIKYYYSRKVNNSNSFIVNRNNISQTANELLNYYKISNEDYFINLKDIDSISSSKKKDLIECSFDLLSRILSVINSDIIEIIAENEYNFIPLVHKYCLKVGCVHIDGIMFTINSLDNNNQNSVDGVNTNNGRSGSNEKGMSLLLNHNYNTKLPTASSGIGNDNVSSVSVKNGVIMINKENEYTELAKQFLNFGILQSNFALIGDISRFCAQYLIPFLSDIIPFLIAHISHPSIPVSNNASWAIGEISIHINSQYIEAYVDEIVKQHIYICQNSKYHGCLLQNICITIGRLCSTYPKKIIYYFPQFLKTWLKIMAHGTQENEKINSLKAILEALYLNLDIAAEHLKDIAYIILKYKYVSQNVNIFFHQFLSTMKQKYPNQWKEIYSPMMDEHSSPIPADMLNDLSTRFNL
ncbi:transportin, putative [Plasmodium chabaudi adami]|uniref:Transportin, putative n=1 Tax=Plasmodium chabaudi adami TaxID=5826 RepID=A0A1C6YGV5_PLACE|nr:transportin, putative [Plasmodium chabaudi adami]